MTRRPETHPLPEFAELFNHSPACLALFEAEEPFRVLFHNDAYQKILDEPFREEGVVGKVIPDFAPNSERVVEIFGKVVATGETFATESYRYDGLERGPTWWNWSLTPVEKGGFITSLVLTSFEVTETVMAQEKLQAEIDARNDAEALLAGEQELFQRIVDIIPVMITMYDGDKNLLLVNKEFERLAGWSTAEARAEPAFEICYPDPAYREEVAEFMSRCEGWKDIHMNTRDGLTLETTWSNVRLSDNRQVGIGIDLTRRKTAEAELLSSRKELALERAFLEAVIEAAPVGISVARDPQGKPPIINREARHMMGIKRLEGGLERYLDLPLHDAEGHRYKYDDLAIIQALKDGKETTNREVIFETKNGYRRWLVNGRPLRDDTGNIRAAIASFVDIEDRRRAEEARGLLVDELNHRVKNTLAIVQSIAAQSFRDLSDPKQAQTKFRARLRALAAAHDLLTETNWSDATLSETITTSLFACGITIEESDRLDISIETDQKLGSKAAVSLSMALHELATNAIKHGALSNETGHLRVRCAPSAVRDDYIQIDWIETGCVLDGTDRREGFGTRLIKSTVEREMKGRSQMLFSPEGFECMIELPRASIEGRS